MKKHIDWFMIIGTLVVVALFMFPFYFLVKSLEWTLLCYIAVLLGGLIKVAIKGKWYYYYHNGSEKDK